MKQRIFRMALFLVIAIAATAFMVACKQAEEINGARYTVLHGAEAAKALDQCSRPAIEGVSGTWNPSAAVIRQLESDLPKLAALKAEMATDRYSASSRTDELENGYRQYVGLVVHGRHVIYINAWRSHRSMPGHEDDWRHKAVNMCDGGSAYWGALYDPSTRSFSNFETNGVA